MDILDIDSTGFCLISMVVLGFSNPCSNEDSETSPGMGYVFPFVRQGQDDWPFLFNHFYSQFQSSSNPCCLNLPFK